MARTSTPALSSSAEAVNRATVAAGFVHGMVSGLRPRGIDPAPILRAAGIDPQVLGDPRARIPIAAYAALYNAIVEHLRDEAFGLLSTPLAPGTFEFLCRGVMSSATLAEAFERSCRFLAIVMPDLEVSVRRAGTAAVIEIRERRALQGRRDDPRRVFAFEWLLRLLHGLGCWLAGRALVLESVDFPYGEPAHAVEYSRIYTEKARFGAPHLAARLDARVLELPVRRDESELAAFLAGAPGRISMLYRPDRALARAVREWIAARLPTAPGLEEAARDLHLSPRTLHRRLRDEGTSFRALREAMRRELALARLGRDGASVAQTAAELGYSEPSAFFRAFQKWMGESPSRFRNKLRIPDDPRSP